MAFALEIPQKLRDEIRPYWRRRRIIIATAWLFSILGWTVVAIMPNRYESVARIYVETENLLTPLLRNIAVDTDIQKQLEVLQRTLLNRNNMATVAHATDLDLTAQTNSERDALYTEIARRVTLKAEGSNIFDVSFTDRDPVLAKKVVDTLLNIFVETNLGQSRSSMENARNFIENQIADYENQLKQQDQRLADYKAQHVELLAATGANFAARLEALRQEESTAKAKYDDAVASRDQLRTSLAATPQYLQVDTPPQVVINNAGASATATLEQRVQAARQELTALQAKFTAKHPDVIEAKRVLEAAEAELKSAKEQAAKDAGSGEGDAKQHGSVSNPVYEQIKLRIVQADSEVAQAQSQLNIVAQEIKHVQSLAATAPKIEADIADLNREYGVIKSKYEELLSRRESARISEAAQNTGDRIEFRIIDAPQVPVLPSFPNRPLFATAVFLVAIGLGCGLAVLLHKIDDTVGTAMMVTNQLKVRVLGSISRVENPARRLERRRSARRFMVATGALVCVYALMMTMTLVTRLANMMATVHLPSVLEGLRKYVG